MTPNQGREKMGLDPDDDKPALNEYYYRGQKLGEKPPAPPGFPGGFPGGPPGGPGEENQSPPGGGSAGAGFGSQNADGSSYGQYADAEKAARSVVVEMLRGYETKLKAALADNDPIDSEQPPVRARRPRRGTPSTVSTAGVASENKPGDRG
jgi:hypothetical protein